MKMTLNSKLKKDWLLLKRERLKVEDQLTKNLSSIIQRSDFKRFDCDLSLTLWERLCRLSIDNKGKLVANGAKYFDAPKPYDEYFRQIKQAFSNYDNEEVYVLPSNWVYSGGFTIKLKSLIEKLDEVLFVTDDDLQIYSSEFNNSIILTGDRHGDSLYLLEVYCLGKKWENLIG